MLCLGIESTAHTFGCSVINHDKNDDPNSISNNDLILSETRDIYKAPAGWGIHPRDASKHHVMVASKILKECLREAENQHQGCRYYKLLRGSGIGTLFEGGCSGFQISCILL